MKLLVMAGDGLTIKNVKKSTEKKDMKLAIKTIKKFLAKDLWVGTQEDVVQILET